MMYDYSPGFGLQADKFVEFATCRLSQAIVFITAFTCWCLMCRAKRCHYRSLLKVWLNTFYSLDSTHAVVGVLWTNEEEGEYWPLLPPVSFSGTYFRLEVQVNLKRSLPWRGFKYIATVPMECKSTAAMEFTSTAVMELTSMAAVDCIQSYCTVHF